MLIILDFDRTIFDTEAFIPHYLAKAPHLNGYSTKEELYVAAARSVADELLSFEKGELDRFLFADVMPFLRAHKPGELILLTWGGEELQRAKVESLDISRYFSRIVYTSDLKGVALKRLLPLPPPIVFVDDDGAQLDSVASEVPEAYRVWMKRVMVRAAPTCDCMSVGSMEELEALLRNLR